MKIIILKKILIVGVICILMLPTIAVASAGSNSDYNLKVKIRNTKFYKNTTTNFCLSVNVSNEGPDASNNYSCLVELYHLWSRWPNWRYNFQNTGIFASYTGSVIAPAGYEENIVTLSNPGAGWYIVKCTLSNGDNNPEDNVSRCLIWVPDLYALRIIFHNLFP